MIFFFKAKLNLRSMGGLVHEHDQQSKSDKCTMSVLYTCMNMIILLVTEL